MSEPLEGFTTAGALLFAPNHENPTDPNICMVLQAENNEWLHPKGGVEPTDKKVIHAAIREVLQETGVNFNLLSVVDGEPYRVEWVSSYDGRAKVAGMYVMKYMGDLEYPFAPHDPEEILAVKWLPQSQRFSPGFMNPNLPSIVAMETVYDDALTRFKQTLMGSRTSKWVRDLVLPTELGMNFKRAPR